MNIILLILSVLSILLYLLRDSKTEGFLDNGSAYKNIKARGAEKTVFIASGVIGLLFMILCIF